MDLGKIIFDFLMTHDTGYLVLIMSLALGGLYLFNPKRDDELLYAKNILKEKK